MFPRRYFPGYYFAPRYFPQSQGVTPTPLATPRSRSIVVTQDTSKSQISILILPLSLLGDAQ